MGLSEEVEPLCFHTDTRMMQTGDGTPVAFCPNCGRNVWIGSLTFPELTAALSPNGAAG